MSEYENNLLAFQPQQSDRNKSSQNVIDLQELVRAKDTEILELRRRLSRSRRTAASQEQGQGENRGQLMLFSSMKDGEAQESQFRIFNANKWIQAQNHYPDDISCLSRRYPAVLVYNPQEEEFYLRRVNELPDQHAIISRIPSWWSPRIHVFVECAPRSSTYRAKVTTKQHASIGMMPYCSICPRKISTTIGLRVLFGDIQWLFVVLPSSQE
ncbi:hypothetical protein GGR51DRAFT_185550 [Nemania sp. FL0031]|nr:hypothetical protein GGR51DRAFT_185550 [Nemania sp. FL0031]